MTTRDLADPDDEDARDRANAAQTLQRRGELEDIKWLLANPQGRRIATRILEKTGNRRTSFNVTNAIMAFNEGQRNVGLWFESELLEANTAGYMKLLKEFQT